MTQLYKIQNNIDNRYYIGVHNGDIFENNYWGSGIWLNRAIKKYGKSNFSREVIAEYDDEALAYWMERALVGSELVDDTICYNLIEGGEGGAYTFNDEERKRISEGTSKWWHDMDDDKRKELIEKRKRFGDRNPNAKSVVHIPTNTIYTTIKEATRVHNISKSQIYRYLTGKYKNKNIFRYAPDN